MTRRFLHNAPWLSSVSRCLGPTQRRDPVSSSIGGQPHQLIAQRRPITASSLGTSAYINVRCICLRIRITELCSREYSFLFLVGTSARTHRMPNHIYRRIVHATPAPTGVWALAFPRRSMSLPTATQDRLMRISRLGSPIDTFEKLTSAFSYDTKAAEQVPALLENDATAPQLQQVLTTAAESDLKTGLHNLKTIVY